MTTSTTQPKRNEKPILFSDLIRSGEENRVSVITGQPSLRGKRNTRPNGITWRQHNRDAVNARKRELYSRDNSKHLERSRAFRKANPERVNTTNRRLAIQYRKKLRAEMIAAYGDCCKCCGESQSMFLQLDHINNDGAAERRIIKTGSHLWAKLKKAGWPSDRYQLLCANCNFGKLLNGGICPHAKNQS